MGEGLKPVGGMVLVQTAFAVVNIFYKLAIDDGMDMRILVAYRYLFAVGILGPLAFFLERRTRPKFTWKVLMMSFLCGLFGGLLAQNLYVASMKLTSATFASAMTNLIPAMTFVLAVLCRLESLEIHAVSGQAKVLGTLLGISGAMLLTFYKGVEINLSSSHIDLLKHHVLPNQQSGNHVMGSLLAVSSCLCYAIWLIIQAKMTESYPCHYTTTALMCLMGSFQAVLYAFCTERDWKQWRMGFDIRLLSVSYIGIVATGLVVTLMAWCIKKKGPLFASVFNPLMLVIVAVLSSFLLNEKLHLGSVLGAVLIVIGLYAVLWGKGREVAKVGEMPADEPVDIVIDRVKSTETTGSDGDPSRTSGASALKDKEIPSTLQVSFIPI